MIPEVHQPIEAPDGRIKEHGYGCIEQRDGNYYIAGTRVSLDSIVHAFRQGESPETICQNFEVLRLDDTHPTRREGLISGRRRSQQGRCMNTRRTR